MAAAWSVPIGAGFNLSFGAPTVAGPVLDAANEATIFIGHVLTSDGATHTVDTTGSSSLGWYSSIATFDNVASTVKFGLAAVDLATGPPARAANSGNIISFDVSKSVIGGGGGLPADSWINAAPDSGSKTIVHGDLVAFCVQMTARGGSDNVVIGMAGINSASHRPAVTLFAGGSYSAVIGVPNAIITFSDGALGYFHACDVFRTMDVQTWDSGSATKEYGQLFALPFPVTVHGAYGWIDPDGDCAIVLYSDPLGTPIAERTVTLDANVVAASAGRRFSVMFPSPYTTVANQSIALAFKPGGASVTAYYRRLASAAHRVADPWGTAGYGVSRAAGAFVNANSSLDHYYVGLWAGGFSAGGTTQNATVVTSL